MALAKPDELSGRSTSISSVSLCVKVTLGFKGAEDFGGGISDTKLFKSKGSPDPAIGKLPMGFLKAEALSVTWAVVASIADILWDRSCT